MSRNAIIDGPVSFDRSRWPTIILIVGAGVVSAFQVGKAPMALAAVQADLAVSLAIVSWLLPAFAIVGAVAGAPIGLAVDRVGAKRMAVGGLVLQAAASALGAFSGGAATLLATRTVEGVGFLAVIVAAPALIVAASPRRDRERAVALWATFMPIGLTLIMLAAPLLSLLQWRGFWLLNAAILIGYAALTAWGMRLPSTRSPQRRNIGEDMRQAFLAPGPWLLGGLFAAFAATFFAVFGFLPSILSDRLEVSSETGSTLSAIAVAASGVGNIVCGQLLARGFRPLRLLFTSFGVMALCGFGIFSEIVLATTAYALCIVFSFIGGLIPVVIFDAVPRYAPRPELVGVTIGFAMQGNNVGLIIGPAAAGAIAADIGWPMVSFLIVVLAIVAATLIFALRALPAREVAPD